MRKGLRKGRGENRLWIALSCLGMILCVVHRVAADNWPNWRGPHQDGNAAGDHYPLEWSDSENIAWKYRLPGRGASTPAIWGDHIFLTFGEEGKNIGLCLDRQGNRRWQVELGQAAEVRHQKASSANSSPITDGERVYFYFKSGDLVAVDFAGKKVWQNNLQQEFAANTLWWDLGTSPVLSREFLIVAVQQTGDSYIVAFDKSTGKQAWKVDRNLHAPNESNQSYTTPLIIERDGEEQLIVLGADHVTAHAVRDGEELWRVGGLNPNGAQMFRSIASPLVHDELVLAPYARGKTLTAIRLGGQGDVTESHVVWESEEAADVPTPVCGAGNRLYICQDQTLVSCIRSDDGDFLWNNVLEKNRTAFSSSPVVAGGHVYLTREDGKTFVIKDAEQFQLVATNSVFEQTVATPVFVDGRIYLRTYDHLYCIADANQ